MTIQPEQPRPRDLTAHQRAGQVVLWMWAGRRMSTAEIAARLDLTYAGAYYMMTHLSLLPWGLWQDEAGYWVLAPDEKNDRGLIGSRG